MHQPESVGRQAERKELLASAERQASEAVRLFQDKDEQWRNSVNELLVTVEAILNSISQDETEGRSRRLLGLWVGYVFGIVQRITVLAEREEGLDMAAHFLVVTRKTLSDLVDGVLVSPDEM